MICPVVWYSDNPLCVCYKCTSVILKAICCSFRLGLAVVTLLGGQHCFSNGEDGTHADPGDIISINCAVDNPDDVINILIWTIPLYSVTVSNTNGNNADDIYKPEFVSTVNSYDSSLQTTNTTLTFPALSVLDGAIVECRGVQANITSECTLFIKSKDS